MLFPERVNILDHLDRIPNVYADEILMENNCYNHRNLLNLIVVF